MLLFQLLLQQHFPGSVAQLVSTTVFAIIPRGNAQLANRLLEKPRVAPTVCFVEFLQKILPTDMYPHPAGLHANCQELESARTPRGLVSAASLPVFWARCQAAVPGTLAIRVLLMLVDIV